MRLNQTYHILVTCENESIIDALCYLRHDLANNPTDLNIAAWVTLINRLQDFTELMQRATPDWRITSREDFADKYEDEVQIVDPHVQPEPA
jgi:hypothetical protein